MDNQQANAAAGASQSHELVFVAKTGIAGQTALTVGGGVALLAVTCLLFIRGANEPATPERSFEPGLNSFFVSMIGSGVLGVFALMHGAYLLRMTRRVVLSVTGVHIHKGLSRRVVPWEQIKSIGRRSRSLPYGGKTIQVLDIIDPAGRRRASVEDSLEAFDLLAQELISRSTAAAGQPTFDAQRNEGLQLAREKRRLRWSVWVFLFFALGSAAALVAGINEEWHNRRYATEGVTADATVVRTWMVKVTPYVEFSFKDVSGRTHQREAMMYPGPAWQMLREGNTVPVVYLPSAPDWNRLVSGEDVGAEFGGKSLFLFSGGFLMFSFMAVVCLLGYDLKTENGVTRLTRHGRVIKEWRQKPTP